MKTSIDCEIKNVFQPQINGINPQNFIENLTGNDLINIYYNKDDGNIIMKKINKLNMNFYMLSERYLKHRNDIDKINDCLFLNLFKQINIYIEEIEKLNLKLKVFGNNIKRNKDNLNELNKENINFNSENNSENITEINNNENNDNNNQKGKNLKLYFITDSNTNESIIHLKKMKHAKGNKKLKSNDNLILYKSLSHEPDIIKKHRKRNSLFSKKSYNKILTENNISTETKHSLFLIEKTNHYFHEDNLENVINNEPNNIKKENKKNYNNNRNKSMVKINKNFNIL
jgi:hypothetical protein